MMTMTFVPERLAQAAVARMMLRPDMAEGLAVHGPMPAGPKWTLEDGDRVLAVGGLEPAGAGRSLAWLLVEDLRPREWAMVRRALQVGIDWASRHGIRRIHAAVAGDRSDHAAFAAGLGLKLTGQDGDDAVMTLELTR